MNQFEMMLNITPNNSIKSFAIAHWDAPKAAAPYISVKPKIGSIKCKKNINLCG